LCFHSGFVAGWSAPQQAWCMATVRECICKLKPRLRRCGLWIARALWLGTRMVSTTKRSIRLGDNQLCKIVGVGRRPCCSCVCLAACNKIWEFLLFLHWGSWPVTNRVLDYSACLGIKRRIGQIIMLDACMLLFCYDESSDYVTLSRILFGHLRHVETTHRWSGTLWPNSLLPRIK